MIHKLVEKMAKKCYSLFIRALNRAGGSFKIVIPRHIAQRWYYEENVRKCELLHDSNQDTLIIVPVWPGRKNQKQQVTLDEP